MKPALQVVGDRVRHAVIAGAMIALAGCALTRQAPVKQMFLLDPPAPPAVAKTQPTSIRVGTINVATPFRGRSFISREGELRYETDYYSEFLVPPSTMLGDATARALERSKAFARVVPPNGSAPSDWTLDAFVSSLYADARDKSFAADVAMTFYLFQSDGGTGAPVWTREYHRRVSLTAPTPQAYAAALNTAFGEVYADLARDLAAADLKKN